MRRRLVLTTVGGMTAFMIGLLTNVVSSQLQISLGVAWALLIFCVLVSWYCAALLLQPSGVDIDLGEGRAPISIMRGFAGVCFLLSWSIVLWIAWTFSTSASIWRFEPLGWTITDFVVIGIFTGFPAGLGIWLLQKDRKRYRKLVL